VGVGAIVSVGAGDSVTCGVGAGCAFDDVLTKPTNPMSMAQPKAAADARIVRFCFI
jgi:hypothetical protein